MSILGHRVVRREDPALLTEGGTYVEDVPSPGALHAVYVRSTVAHGRVVAIDVDEARTRPGVVAVVTAADIDLPHIFPLVIVDQNMSRPLLATDTVRFVGEPIVAVVAETRVAAIDAAESVIVEIDPLDALVDPWASLDDAIVLHPSAGTNVAMAIDHHGEPISFDDCDVVVTAEIVNQRLAPAPIEPRSAMAWWADGRLVLEIGCQGPHPIRTAVAELYGLAPEEVRVICPDVGGGFGAKAQAPAESLLLPELARRTGRPVRWVETRSENLVAMNHGRGQIQTITLGGSADGDLQAYRIHLVQDSGAYPNMGAILPFATRIMATGVYEIPSGRVQLPFRGHHHHPHRRLSRGRPPGVGRRPRTGRRPLRRRGRPRPGRRAPPELHPSVLHAVRHPCGNDLRLRRLRGRPRTGARRRRVRPTPS